MDSRSRPTADSAAGRERATAADSAWLQGDDAMVADWLRGRPAQTRRSYSTAIARFRATLATPLAAVTLADLQGYADSLAAAGLAPASQRRMLASIKSLLAFAYLGGHVPANAGRAMRLPPVRSRLAERIPSKEDVRTLLAHEPDPRNHALIRLLYATGLRLAEACALRWRDLQPRGAEGQVTVWGKGAKERAVLMTAGTWHEVLTLRPPDADPGDPVFVSRHNRPLSPVQAWRIVKMAAVRAELETAALFSPHWLRHAHASHALDHGAPASLVRDGLGHASLLTTSLYTHARPDDGSGRYLPLE